LIALFGLFFAKIIEIQFYDFLIVSPKDPHNGDEILRDVHAI